MSPPRLCALAMLLAPLPAAAATPAEILAALAAADSPALADLVQQTYEGAGLSWDDRLVWRFESYDYTFNYFDPREQLIVLGSVPEAGEIEAYWLNWSRTLTGGRWVPAAFFTDPAEATALARFNQFIIALHEAAHAVTYRYDYGHVARHDYSVNCREFYADRLTAAALDDLAEAAGAFASLRTRYLALIADMDASIAPQLRHSIPSLAALEADCSLIDVAQPTPESLEAYASAFFERHRLLLSVDLPSLAEMAEAHLFPPLAAFMADMPHIPAHPDYRLESIGTVPEFQPVSDFLQGPGHFAPGFADDGQLFLARIDYDAETARIDLHFGPPGALEPVLLAADYPAAARDLQLVNIAPSNPDLFHGLISEPQQGAAVGFTPFTAARTDGQWEVSFGDTLPDMQLARLLLTPSGRLALLASDDAQPWGFNAGWVGVLFDPATGETVATHGYDGLYGLPLAVSDTGQLITIAYDLLYEFETDGRFWVVAGNGLPGLKDGTTPATTELIDPSGARLMPDGTLLFLDAAPDGTSAVIRRLNYPAGGQ